MGCSHLLSASGNVRNRRYGASEVGQTGRHESIFPIVWTCQLTKENTVASMRLAPALSRLVFYFRAEGDITAEQLDNVTVDLNGLPTIGSFNVVEGRFSADTESVASFRMRTSSSTDATVARTTEAFVMPLGGTQGYVATINANKLPDALKKKTYTIGSSIGSFERGMQYVFDVTPAILSRVLPHLSQVGKKEIKLVVKVKKHNLS